MVGSAKKIYVAMVLLFPFKAEVEWSRLGWKMDLDSTNLENEKTHKEQIIFYKKKLKGKLC